MQTAQELLDKIMPLMQKQASLEQIEAVSKGDMRLYHAGQVRAYKEIAEELVNRHGCKATFIGTEKEG